MVYKIHGNEKYASNFDKESNSSSDLTLSQQEKILQGFVKNMLQGRQFTGQFVEERYVASVKSFRDVVVVSQEERELIEDLVKVRRRIRVDRETDWIGITTPDTVGAAVGYCLWVELKQKVFGSYLYKIKSIRFRDGEVLLKLKMMRASVADGDKVNVSYVSSSSPSKNYLDTIYSTIIDMSQAALKGLKYGISKSFEILTAKNIYETIVFFGLLIGTLVVFIVNVIKYLFDFSLKFMREISYLTQSWTPVMLGIIDMFTKAFGGILILIWSIFSDNRRAPPPYMPQTPMITYRNNATPTPRRRYGRPLQITPVY